MSTPAPIFSRTRIAPTPSGYLHLGNVLSFAITAALAKKTGAKILLRIDDLDRERVNRLYVQDIFDTLIFLEIPYDEGQQNLEEYEAEWSQVHRMDMYNAALQQLKEQDAVFACTCSRAQIRAINPDDTYPGTCRHKNIPLDAENVSWRLKTDTNEVLNIKTFSGETIQTTLPATMQYFVVRKKDGYPAYQLTSVLDDIHFGIDLIVRGQDLWASTLAQYYLAPLIGADAFRDVTFYHHPLLMASGTEKLSKSAGATSVHYLRGEGKTRADVFTAIAEMLGVGERMHSWEELAGLIGIAP
ncbi:MAG: glutamate--tRNA ligase family protein [Bacteroidota bacterium]